MSGCCGSSAYVDVEQGGPDGIELDASYDPENPFFEDDFDENFWKQVRDLRDEKKKSGDNVDKLTAQRLVRIDRLSKACKDAGKDVVIDLIKTKHDMYEAWCRKNNAMDQFSTFVFILTKFVKLILEKDFVSEEPEYLQKMHEIPDDPDETMCLILHLAAERNLTEIMEVILAKQRGLTNVTTYPDDYLPLWYALKNDHDEAASMLVAHMPNHDVRDVFEDGENQDYVFSAIIENGKMKKTVEAVLDSCMNPDWPFMPSGGDNGDDEEGIVLPDIPFRYHFFYRLLDGDDQGRAGKSEDGKINPEFNANNSKSNLQLIAENSTSEDATIRHPVVRMLMRSKWEKFGRKYIRLDLLLYVVFLSAMSVAFLVDAPGNDRTAYKTSLDNFRLVCEIVTLSFTLIFIYSEMDEVRRDKLDYFLDAFNYFDVLGLVLILVVIPLRFAGLSTAEYGISAAAYLVNFLRIGKTATAFKSTSIYLKTFVQIIKHEIFRFLGVFIIIMLSFTGALFLALKAENAQPSNMASSSTLNGTSDAKGYWYVFMQEVRSLAEANPYGETDDYKEMHVVVVILVMINMFTCIVVLNNILIAQIGDSFSNAQAEAAVQYDIDRTKLVTRIEAKGLFCSTRLRARHYVDAEFLSNDVLEADLLDDWIMLKKNTQDLDAKKDLIKSMMTIRKDPSLLKEKSD